MFNSIVSMLKIGIPIRKISRDLKIDRNTVRSVQRRITGGVITPPVIERKSSLDDYEEKMIELLNNNYSAKQIYFELSKLGVKISYPSVTRFLKKHKSPEAFVPMISNPGEEAQVDFGYVGRFLINNSIKSCYVFCMTLSHSRYRLIPHKYCSKCNRSKILHEIKMQMRYFIDFDWGEVSKLG